MGTTHRGKQTERKRMKKLLERDGGRGRRGRRGREGGMADTETSL